MGKITEYNEVTSLVKDDVFVVESSGTKKITVQNVLPALAALISSSLTELSESDYLAVMNSSGILGITPEDAALSLIDYLPAYMHRNIYRGKNLGTGLTSTQVAAIQAGTFDDLYVGDYWVINGVTWQIVDIDYWYNKGDTAFTNHHVVVMPQICLYSTVMNETNTTEGGYVGSLMYTEGLDDAKTAFVNAFGSSHILSHRVHLTNAVSNGYPSAGAWYDSTVELPNEIMMYGSHIFAPAGDGSFVPYRYTADNTQLALMRLVPYFITSYRQSQWLRDVVSSTSFAGVGYSGDASYANASYSRGVRPVAAIG